ncbi:App1 family protein [Actinoplanes xinjiangensis]|jgi:phosphatidate phosphatase APP1|uniref:Phosphatidate phosphatase APP1 n=1 Tax=Actinoplanes xinjiangensis TaxID=512350 RepID=A0A316FST2_9ACTN|nr:phosphatase domain-containing protein [Actinoplanes xinjiangensis]PWK51292.1 phosphatidate phosphatase APP1 [Actinoplanes xinjiangensis]
MVRIHRAALIEDAVHEMVERRLRGRGWKPYITAYTGYGGSGWARVMARVLLARPGTVRRRREKVRGWRSFTTTPVSSALVRIELGNTVTEARTDRSGYLDVIVKGDLNPGWGCAKLSTEGTVPVEAPIRVIDPGVKFGVISDIDDTVMVTTLPRPLLAAWNTFVLDEHARAAVPGMAVLYERLVHANPGTPVVYLSTGAWNVAPTLTRFLSRHLYPAGPILLTDWGPTPDRWFRSGQEHKRKSLRRLAEEFPDVRWLLIGDDGQHDQEIYSEFAREYPQNVAAVAIRRLSPTQAVLAGAVPGPSEAAEVVPSGGKNWFAAPDGAGLWSLLRDTDLVPKPRD